MHKTGALALFPAVFMMLAALPAAAQPAGLFPPKGTETTATEYTQAPGEENYPMLRLTPDKPQIVHLDAEARSIIVGNPAHLNVIMDNSTSLVMIPRDPGATHFTVIGKDGKVVMQRYVIVASPAEKYMRIRRSCHGAADCAETSIYYCPDMCYETGILNSSLGQPGNVAPLPGAAAKTADAETSGHSDDGAAADDNAVANEPEPDSEPAIEEEITEPAQETPAP